MTQRKALSDVPGSDTLGMSNMNGLANPAEVVAHKNQRTMYTITTFMRSKCHQTNMFSGIRGKTGNVPGGAF